MESTRSQVTDSPRLVVIEGNDKGKVIPLKDGSVIIGRSKGDVLVHDPRVSRSHVALHFDADSGTLSFTDLKSLNGTLVNGNPSESGELKDGDKLQIGNTVFDCQMGDVVQKAKSISKPDELIPLASDSGAVIEDPGTAAHAQQLKTKELPKFSFSAEALKKLPLKSRNMRIGAVLLLLLLLYASLDFTPSHENFDRDVQFIKNLQGQGRLEDAVIKAEELRKQYAGNPKSYMTLGDLYSAQHRIEAALEMYRKAHGLTPNQPLVHVRLARLLLQTSLKKEAKVELSHIDDEIKSGTRSKEFFVESAQLFLDFQELSEAGEKAFILARALQTELAPNSTIGYRLETQALRLQNQPEQAVKAVEAGLKIDTTDEWLLENQFFLKLNLKDLDGAARASENWIHFHPDNTKALLVAAYLKVNDKNYSQALPHVTRVIQLLSKSQGEPHYGEALNLAGQIHWAQNQKTEAESYLKQACGLGFQQACLHELVRGHASQPETQLQKQ